MGPIRSTDHFHWEVTSYTKSVRAFVKHHSFFHSHVKLVIENKYFFNNKMGQMEDDSNGSTTLSFHIKSLRGIALHINSHGVPSREHCHSIHQFSGAGSAFWKDTISFLSLERLPSIKGQN